MPYTDVFPILGAWMLTGEGEETTTTPEPDNDTLSPMVDADENVDRIVSDVQTLNAVIRESDKITAMLLNIQEAFDLQAHMEEYGLSRDFVAWYNRDGKLQKFMRIQIPGLASLDAVGDPSDKLSMACQESLKEIAGNVWKVIRGVAKQVQKFAIAVANTVLNYNKMMEQKITKAKELINSRENDPSKANETFKGFDLVQIKEHAGRIATVAAKVVKQLNDINAQATNAANANNGEGNNATDPLTKVDEALSNEIKTVMEQKPKEQKDIQVTANAKNMAIEYLNYAEQMLGVLKGNSDANKAANDATKKVDAEAAKHEGENAQTKGNKAATIVRSLMGILNKSVRNNTSVIKERQWCCSSAYAAATHFGETLIDKGNKNQQKQEEVGRTQQDEDMDDPMGDGVRAMQYKGGK